ncbi:hypothetical protein H4Q26_001534 [Puccinia striiformis f. sp. tritici PST-130]|uniref:ATPase domain-containing protein n=1 Tax=Puccinia striiformis f. sp. tritici PST-78 TaxID=1165861 RepID=A0A0L0UZF0_9BASI|nr:hypothetical protein H4Q26_001534 [Puccinia striiformis f. sp. tritici PST-130]KNE92422.1 hypothetical protein PSTG_14143 [Puccinia striiformis f. sp. tritici PST-78]
MLVRNSNFNLLRGGNSQRVIRYAQPQLERRPSFSVWLGPPSSGKTALARHLTSQTRPDGTLKFNALTIDLRGMDTTAPDGLLKALVRTDSRRQIGTFSGSFDQTLPPSSRLVSLLNDLGRRLEPWSFSNKDQPVLIIDEANVLKEMDKHIVNVLLDFALDMTQSDSKMHIIFTTSDSLFMNWLAQRINSTYFETLVVGDLSRGEANKYFLHAVENDPQLSKETKEILSSMDFSIVYKMTGGGMFFIRRYINEVDESGYFDDPEHFEAVQNEYSGMLHDFTKEAKTYGKGEMLTVCSDSPGYISYIQLVRKLGRRVVDEILERNFIHRRQGSNFSKDDIPDSIESFVTANSQPALCAMERLVKEVGPEYPQYSRK